MKRILVVDGDMTVRAQIGRYARLEGYDGSRGKRRLYRRGALPAEHI